MKFKIIHRTFNKDLKFTNKKEILKNVNYFSIRNKAWQFLIDMNITSLPIDLNKVTKMLGLTMARFSKIKHTEIYPHVLNTAGAKVIIENKTYIFVNDALPYEVQRFTVAHELGHHYLKNDRKPYEVAETEANMFAARILMPMCIIKELQINKTSQLMQCCLVSEEAAKFRLKRYKKVVKRNKFYSNPLEEQLIKNFKEFITTKLRGQNNG